MSWNEGQNHTICNDNALCMKKHFVEVMQIWTPGMRRYEAPGAYVTAPASARNHRDRSQVQYRSLRHLRGRHRCQQLKTVLGAFDLFRFGVWQGHALVVKDTFVVDGLSPFRFSNSKNINVLVTQIESCRMSQQNRVGVTLQSTRKNHGGMFHGSVRGGQSDRRDAVLVQQAAEAQPPKLHPLHPLHLALQIRRIIVTFRNTSNAISGRLELPEMAQVILLSEMLQIPPAHRPHVALAS